MPSNGNWLCNASQGGTTHASSLTKAEEHIVNTVAAQVIKHGVHFFGIDTLCSDSGERVLSEVNCVTVGGMLPLQEASDRPIVADAAKALWKLWKPVEELVA